MSEESILIVEDEPAVRDMLRRTLSNKGYEVLAAGGSSEALSLCAEHRGPLHLLLTDMRMLEGNGYDLARQLSLMKPQMKVMFMSGYMDSKVHQKILSEGKSVILKPFQSEILARKVREVLEGNGNGR